MTALVACLLASAMALGVAFSRVGAFRVELGGPDESFRAGGPSAWSRGYEDSGPYRTRRGEKRMEYFAARMAHDGAALEIPASWGENELELRLRGHRYGEPGVVHVLGNGIRLGSLVFREDSYPWDVSRLRVPREIADASPFRLEFVYEAVQREMDLPPGAVVAFDWVELAPVAGSAAFRPSGAQWAASLAMPALVLATLHAGGAPLAVSAVGGAAALAGVIAGIGFATAPTLSALGHLWMVFPLGFAVWIVLRRGFEASAGLARGLSATFVLVLLGHATIIFFPDHLPPDLGPHLGQVSKLSGGGFRWEHFWDFSASFGVTGQGKPHFGAAYEAPYPPWTYFLIHGLSRLIDHPRFWLEFLALTCAALLVLLTYGLARALASERGVAGLAVVLQSLEISTWHHAARAHTPAIFGQVFFLAAVTYLAHRTGDLANRWVFVRFALLSGAAALAYTATLFHLGFFVFCLLLVQLVENRSVLPLPSMRRVLAGSLAGMALAFGVFYHRFVATALASRSAIFSRTAYRAPARFFLLRNQMRDTARILWFGYPVWILLALPALVRVSRWSSGRSARRLILGWTLAYALLLLLKDPMLFPQILLHAKEDLFFAPLASVLSAMTLAQLARRGRTGKALVGAVLAGMLVLQVRDYLYNADTVSAWVSAVHGAE